MQDAVLLITMMKIIILSFCLQTVHEDIHDDVVERLKKAYAQVRIGDPLEGK